MKKNYSSFPASYHWVVKELQKIEERFLNLEKKVKDLEKENALLRNNFKITKINIAFPEDNNFYLYYYLKEFYPDNPFYCEYIMGQGDKTTFSSIKEARDYVLHNITPVFEEEVQVVNKYRPGAIKLSRGKYMITTKAQGYATLSDLTKDYTNSFKCPNHMKTAILLALDARGLLDYKGKTFNNLGKVAGNGFKFIDNDRTRTEINWAYNQMSGFTTLDQAKEEISRWER